MYTPIFDSRLCERRQQALGICSKPLFSACSHVKSPSSEICLDG